MEILGLYDNDGKLIDRTIVRGDENLNQNENIKLVTIWIKCNNKFLIQKTSKEKGSEFAVTGGHVQAGQTSASQACLELQEELGLTINPNDLTFVGSIFGNHSIFDVLIIENDNLEKYHFVLQKEEVKNIYWLNKSEIEKIINNGQMRKSTALQFKKFFNN